MKIVKTINKPNITQSFEARIHLSDCYERQITYLYDTHQLYANKFACEDTNYKQEQAQSRDNI
jgi:hypothetical protein